MEKITMLYFAAVKDITGKEQEMIQIENNWTLTDLSTYLVQQYGAKLKELLSTSMYAMDMEYIAKDQERTTLIQPSMEIAIIPPVSGG